MELDGTRVDCFGPDSPFTPTSAVRGLRSRRACVHTMLLLFFTRLRCFFLLLLTSYHSLLLFPLPFPSHLSERARRYCEVDLYTYALANTVSGSVLLGFTWVLSTMDPLPGRIKVRCSALRCGAPPLPAAQCCSALCCCVPCACTYALRHAHPHPLPLFHTVVRVRRLCFTSGDC